MTTSDIKRIEAFEHRFAKAQATDVIDLPFGYAVLQERFPFSHSHNRLVVTTPTPAAEIMTAADDVLGGAGCTHRFVSVVGRLGQDPDHDLHRKFAAAGYEHGPVATMQYFATIKRVGKREGKRVGKREGKREGKRVAERSPAAHPVQAVSFETMRPALLADWRRNLPEASDDVIRQLADRTTLYERGATSLRLAVIDGGEVAAKANLYLDRADSIAQFEELATHPDFRNRGYAGALLRDAVRRGREAGADVFFLTADLDDWPRGWYRRFGFADVALTHHFDKGP